jgi:hypothetical protein
MQPEMKNMARHPVSVSQRRVLRWNYTDARIAIWLSFTTKPEIEGGLANVSSANGCARGTRFMIGLGFACFTPGSGSNPLFCMLRDASTGDFKQSGD